MRFIFLLSIAFSIQVRAKTNSQKVTVNDNNLSFGKISNTIKQQAGYMFVHNPGLIKDTSYISLYCKNESLENILYKCFESQDITYKINHNTIVLKKNNIAIMEKHEVQNILFQQNIITGTISDKSGKPMQSVSVIVISQINNRGVFSDSQGKFTIQASEQDSLRFTSVGYIDKTILVGSNKVLNIVMEEKGDTLNDVVVVGYGTQKKNELTSSVASIQGKDIMTTKNENVMNMLTGKLAGVRVVQKSSEPGTFNNTFDIRGLGDALVIIDGVPRTNMSRINPEDIESVSVLKDASAAIYGVRAANGVVLITTKKGKKGVARISYSGNFTLQTPIGSPKSTSAVDWMTLANEKSMHKQSGGTLRYSLDEIQEYRNGDKKGTDWYDAIISSSAPQMEHTLSTSGGTDKLQYYASIGYMNQQSFLRSNSNDYSRYNIRTNVTGQISNRLKMEVDMSGIYDKSDKNYQSTDWIIRSMERSSPIQPIYANNNSDYLQNGKVDGSNAVAMADANQSGYNKNYNKWFQSSVSLEYDMPFITGLKIKGMFSYDYQAIDNKIYQKTYNLYDYDDASETYNAVVNQSPSTILRQYYSKENVLTQLSLNYNRSFNNVHNVTALLLYEGQSRKGDNFYAQRNLALPLDQLSAGSSDDQVANMSTSLDNLYDYANIGYVGRFNYNFKSKYIAEFGFRYDGSSKFVSTHRWGFFPSGSIGWRFTDENFWKSLNIGFINDAKIRVTYGLLGDDGASTYQYLNGYTYPANGSYNDLPSGSYFDGTFVSSSASTGIANKNITWYKAKTLDVGLDINSKNKILGIVLDYFQRYRNGLLATRSVSLPSVVGAALPQENLNGDVTRGIDLEVNHNYHIGKVLYSLKGTFGFTRTKYTHQEIGTYGSSYTDWRNNNNDRYSDIVWGYIGNGQFQSYDEIANSKVKYSNNTLPGDYKYKDVNGDGIISDLDMVPMSYSGRPMFTYGLTANFSWKGFDLNLLLQGAAKVWVNYVEILAEPMWGSDYSNALQIFMDRWHPADPTADPYNPNTKWIKGKYAFTGSTPYSNSTFSYNDASYIRLKSVEVGYTFPSRMMKKIGVQDIRVYANVYNAYTWSKMKFIDPEHPNDSYGNVYPLNRSYSLGVNIDF